LAHLRQQARESNTIKYYALTPALAALGAEQVGAARERLQPHRALNKHLPRINPLQEGTARRAPSESHNILIVSRHSVVFKNNPLFDKRVFDG